MNDGEYKAGRELDTIIAEKVMGWRHGQDDTFCELPFISCPVCAVRFSTNIACAWLVVEKLQQSKMMMSLSWSEGDHYYCEEGTADDPTPIHRCTASWCCVIYPKEGLPFEGPHSESAPLAICRAALLWGGEISLQISRHTARRA